MTTLIRLPQVTHRAGKPRSSIYEDMQKGTFPTPVKIGKRSVAWIEEEVDAWIEERIADTRGKA